MARTKYMNSVRYNQTM